MKTQPVLYSICLTSYHREKFPDWPPVLCELFLLERPVQMPLDIANFPVTLGGGYGRTISFPSPPSKQLSQESLSSVRKKRLTRRFEKRYGFFYDHFIQEEISRKADYYNGITDEKLARDQKEYLDYYQTRWQMLLENVGVLLVYSQEPPESKIYAASLPRLGRILANV